MTAALAANSQKRDFAAKLLSVINYRYPNNTPLNLIKAKWMDDPERKRSRRTWDCLSYCEPCNGEMRLLDTSVDQGSRHRGSDHIAL